MQSKQDKAAMLDFLDRPLNPWITHGKELLRIHEALSEAFTWKQFQVWQGLVEQDTARTFRSMFTKALKVSKSAKVHALATEGLKLVERCETLSKG